MASEDVIKCDIEDSTLEVDADDVNRIHISQTLAGEPSSLCLTRKEAVWLHDILAVAAVPKREGAIPSGAEVAWQVASLPPPVRKT